MRRLVRGGEGATSSTARRSGGPISSSCSPTSGLGGTMHSIVSQGKVDAVLASKPADRRELVEEAAGLGQVQAAQASRRAQARPRRHPGRAGARRRGGGAQAPAPAGAAGDGGGAGGEARGRDRADCTRASHSSISQAIEERRATAEERRTAAALVRRTTQERLTALLEERRQAEDELSDAAGKREAAVSALYRLQGVSRADRRCAGRRRAGSRAGSPRSWPSTSAHRRSAGDETVRALEAEAARLAAAPARRRRRAASQPSAHGSHTRGSRPPSARRRSAAEERLDEAAEEREDVEAALADASGAGRAGTTACRSWRCPRTARASPGVGRGTYAGPRGRPRRGPCAGRARRAFAGRAGAAGERGGRGGAGCSDRA